MRAERRLLLAGLAGLLAVLAAMIFIPADALRAWLAALFLWSGIPVGSIGLWMMIRLVPGRWGEALMLPAEAGAALLPLSAAAALPVLIGMGALYPWVHHPPTGFKGAWLNPVFFAGRTLFWFALLGGLAWLLLRRRGPAAALSSAGLILLTVFGSLILFDWLLSLTPEFHSSGFGLYGLAIQFKVALMAGILAAVALAPERIAGLGALAFTMLLLWAYFLFMPYIVGWSGNLGSVAPWWIRHGRGGWWMVIAGACAIQAVPMLLLLSPTVRGSARLLRIFAVTVLAGTALETAWLVLPQGGPVLRPASLLFLLAAFGIGSLSLAGYRLAVAWRVDARTPEASA